MDLTLEQMRSIRGNRISMIFQEPMTSLNPVFTIGNQISEMFILHEEEFEERGLGTLNRDAHKGPDPGSGKKSS